MKRFMAGKLNRFFLDGNGLLSGMVIMEKA